MSKGWENVYVFISSTFNDMHAERDYLVKRVFPQLQDWCESRKLRLVDIDLRWGVTELDATNARVAGICLERVDACRPFFVCLLGQRYGWVPQNRRNEDRGRSQDARRLSPTGTTPSSRQVSDGDGDPPRGLRALARHGP